MSHQRRDTTSQRLQSRRADHTRAQRGCVLCSMALTLTLISISACTPPTQLPAERGAESQSPWRPQPVRPDQLMIVGEVFDMGGSSAPDVSVPSDPDMNSERDQAPSEIDQALDQMLDPCDGVSCGEHGACVADLGQSARCVCEARYVARGLSCEPEDLDQDGFAFTEDCHDDDRAIYPGAVERCDRVDQDCDQEIDEGACSMWVLEPRSNTWDSYALDVSGGPNVPRGTIKAAWDIESLDIGFVITETGFHELRLSTLAWGPQQPLDDLFTGHGGSVSDGAYAYSVPAAHGGGSSFETVTVTLVAPSGVQRVWLIKYDLNERSFNRYGRDVLYGDPHSWDDINAPPSTGIRASWLDVDNGRSWLSASPRALCGANADATDPYSGIITEDYLYIMESGFCFKFVEPAPLIGSPLDLPGAPKFDEVGGAFWHQGALYLFRGD